MNFELLHENQWTSNLYEIEGLLSYSKVMCIDGSLGSGKTTFCKHFCAHMGCQDIVQSPTFSLIHQYTIGKGNDKQIIHHLDLYRLEKIEELMEIGIEEILDSGDICLIEWPGLAIPLLDRYILMRISVVENNLRRVNFIQV